MARVRRPPRVRGRRSRPPTTVSDAPVRLVSLLGGRINAPDRKYRILCQRDPTMVAIKIAPIAVRHVVRVHSRLGGTIPTEWSRAPPRLAEPVGRAHIVLLAAEGLVIANGSAVGDLLLDRGRVTTLWPRKRSTPLTRPTTSILRAIDDHVACSPTAVRLHSRAARLRAEFRTRRSMPWFSVWTRNPRFRPSIAPSPCCRCAQADRAAHS